MAFDFPANERTMSAVGVDAPRATASISTCFSLPSDFMQKNKEHVLHARQLLADIVGSPSVWLPRRDAVTDWLNQFLTRATQPAYALGDTEAEDLTALDTFLRGKKIPVA
jgi:hypothetical protein